MSDFSRRVLLHCSLAPLIAAQPRPDPPKHKLKLLFAGGHPGDQEYGCGGTIARSSDLGHEVVLLYLNRGDWGFLDKPPKSPLADRVAEVRNACRILKARAAFASQLNGKAVVDHAHAGEFRKLFEAENPDVIFTQWPMDNHADHRAIFALVYETWLAMGRRAALYFYEVSNGEDTLMFAPTHYVDVSAFETRKREACYAHASQSPDRYYEMQMKTMAFRGLESGCKYAEAYIRHVQSREGFLPGR